MINLDIYTNIEDNKLITNLKYQGDLIYHEGALLSHFIDNNTNNHYFYKWSDKDNICNRWLIFKVTVKDLISFFEKKLNLLQLIQVNDFVYFIDLDANLNQVNSFICSTQKIPNDYLLSEKSYFKEKQYERYAFELKNKLT